MHKRKKTPAERRGGTLCFNILPDKQLLTIATNPCTGGQRNTTGEHGP